MNIPKLFKNLSNEQKVDFFVNCQKLLINHHSNSEFVIRESKLNEAVDIFLNQINKYKGYYYSDDNVCILWNHVYVSDPTDTQGELIKNAYQEPNPNYNAVSMDFVVCRKSSDILDFIKNYDEDRIKYLLSVKYGRAKILNKEDLVKNIKFF